MSDKKQEQASVELCNLTSRGISLNEAKEILAKKKEATIGTEPKETKKPTAKERKEKIAEEIKKLGGEAPKDGESVAIFEQTLEALKKQSDKKEDDFM
ncbi:hypothetical protein OAB00_01215 [Akkermansiaceae bacterium]|nr:hypothetical protein [Akkermansiaceae bacterium]